MYLTFTATVILFCFHFATNLVTLVLPIPDPQIPEQHEPWCPLGKERNRTEKSLHIFYILLKCYIRALEFHLKHSYTTIL